MFSSQSDLSCNFHLHSPLQNKLVYSHISPSLHPYINAQRCVCTHTHIHTHLLVWHGYSPDAGLWKSIVPHPSMGGWISNYLPSMLNYFNISTTSTYPLIIITNTLFQQHKRRLYTGTSSDGQHRISDWLYSLQPKMEKLYTVSKNKTRSWLWLRPWTPYCQIQT